MILLTSVGIQTQHSLRALQGGQHAGSVRTQAWYPGLVVCSKSSCHTQKVVKNRKRMLAVGGAVMLGATLLSAPGLPWSGRSRYAIRRWSAKFATTLADLRGQHPRTVSLTGKLTGTGAFVEAVRGARVNALESGSGYAAMSDGEGRFVLPHLTWYPGATFTLFISVNQYQARSMKVRAPLTCPNDGVIDLGALSFDQAIETDDSDKPERYLRYDIPNRDYYVDIFERLTAASRTNHEKLVAITGYVSTKRNPEQRALSFRSARQVLERGAPHCSHLAFAMAAITAAGGFPTRTVHITDTPEYRHTHVAVEVFYESAWHLYDPTYGVSFFNRNGSVASHTELRLTPALITLEAFPEPSEFAREALEWMPNAYGSGIYQTYQVGEAGFVDACPIV